MKFRLSAVALLGGALRLRAMALLCTVVLGLPVLALGWELRPSLTPVLWTLALVSLYVVVTWPLRAAGHWLVRGVASLALLGIGGTMLASVMLLSLFSVTDQSLPLVDGCRVDVDRVGGFGDTDVHLVHRCPVGGLWSRSKALLSDSEAVVSQLRNAGLAADGRPQVSVTLSRYGKPDEQRSLGMPAR